MSYPQGIPAQDMDDIWTSGNFTPSDIVTYIRDRYTPVTRTAMRNSVGYQISLLQNWVNKVYLGRADDPVESGYFNNVTISGLHGLGNRIVIDNANVLHASGDIEVGNDFYVVENTILSGYIDVRGTSYLAAIQGTAGTITTLANTTFNNITINSTSGNFDVPRYDKRGNITVRASDNGYYNFRGGMYVLEQSGLAPVELKLPWQQGGTSHPPATDWAESIPDGTLLTLCRMDTNYSYNIDIAFGRVDTVYSGVISLTSGTETATFVMASGVGAGVGMKMWSKIN